MLACTFILLSLSSLTIFFASSISTPTFTVQERLTLLPLTLSIFSLISRHLISTPRLVSLPLRMSCTWFNWNSLSANTVSTSSACSTRASEPLKSKRVLTSLLVCSTAFLTSVFSTSETMSKDGMVVAPLTFAFPLPQPLSRRRERGACSAGEGVFNQNYKRNAPLRHPYG